MMKGRMVIFLISLVFVSISFSLRAETAYQPLSLVLLMDSSGSMKRTDPEGIRKLAAQAIITMLSPSDEVAIVEFSTDAKVLSDWKPSSEREELFSAISKVSEEGMFTDFRAGLESAKKLILKAPKGNRRVVLLLSDGILEPNPYSDRYAPYYIQYRLATMRKSKGEKLRIYREKFRSKLSPVAKRLINSDILPLLRENKVEIYTIGFSPEADRGFLRYLADETSRAHMESHCFYAREAGDLMDAFTDLLYYWGNMMKLYSEEGEVHPGRSRVIFIDEFLKDPLFLVLTEKKCEFSVQSENGVGEAPLEGTHPKLRIVPLLAKTPPGEWIYGFKSGSGRYKLMILGRSAIAMEVRGLEGRYLYGRPIEALVILKIGEKDARSFLGSSSKVIAEIASEVSEKRSLELREVKRGFKFKYTPQQSGLFRIKFTLFAKDKAGREILPRPSREYKVEVMPRFFVEPGYIDFGDLKRGRTRSTTVKIHFGLPERREIRVKGIIKTKGEDKLPFIREFSFSIEPGQILQKEIYISAPKGGKWGDFEGEILFKAEDGESYGVGFHVHVPSKWEWLTKAFLFLILLIILALIFLSGIWGLKASPVGVLRPLKVPTGVIMTDIELSKVKKGILKRWLNWKKNVVTIGGRGDVELGGIPGDMKAELIFHRFGGNYIRNASPKNSNCVITVINPDVGATIRRGSGESYRLSHGLKIIMGDYTLRYENIKGMGIL